MGHAEAGVGGSCRVGLGHVWVGWGGLCRGGVHHTGGVGCEKFH